VERSQHQPARCRPPPSRGQHRGAGLRRTTRFGELVGGLACSDTVVHTWDLARATGQPETLDAGAVEHCAGVIAGFGEAMRRPGGFGPPLDGPADADAQSKFLHFAGSAV